MEDPRRTRNVALFAAKFAVCVPVCLIAWWLVLPAYVWCLGFVSQPVLRYVANVPVESFSVSNTGLTSPHGILNTGTRLNFVLEEGQVSSKLGHLVTNVAPFIALVLATAGLTVRRRAKIVAVGTAILATAHVAFIFINFTLGATEISTGISQLFITMPFLLWIVLAYWDKLTFYFSDANGDGPPHDTPSTP